MKTPDEETDGRDVAVTPEEKDPYEKLLKALFVLPGGPTTERVFESSLPPGLPPESMPEAAVALLELLGSANGVVLNLGSEILAIEREKSLLSIRANKLDQVKSEVQRMLAQQLPGKFSVEYYQQLQQNIANKVAFARNDVLKQARPLGPIQPLPPPTVGDWYKFAVESEEVGQRIVASCLPEMQYRELDLVVSMSVPDPDLDEAAANARRLGEDEVAESFEKVKEADKIVSMSVPDPDLDEDVFFDEPAPKAPAQRKSFIDRVFNWVMDRLS